MNIRIKMTCWLAILLCGLTFISLTQTNSFAEEVDWNVSVPWNTFLSPEEVESPVSIQYAQDKAGNIIFLVVTKNQKSGALIFVARTSVKTSITQDTSTNVKQNTAYLMVGQKKLPPPNSEENFIFVDGDTVVRQKVSLQKKEMFSYIKGYVAGYVIGKSD